MPVRATANIFAIAAVLASSDLHRTWQTPGDAAYAAGVGAPHESDDCCADSGGDPDLYAASDSDTATLIVASFAAGDYLVFEVSFAEPHGLADGWRFQVFIDVDGSSATGYWRGFDRLVRGMEFTDDGSVWVRDTAGDGGPGGWGPAIATAFVSMPDDTRLFIDVPLAAISTTASAPARFAFETYRNDQLVEGVYDCETVAISDGSDGPTSDNPDQRDICVFSPDDGQEDANGNDRDDAPEIGGEEPISSPPCPAESGGSEDCLDAGDSADDEGDTPDQTPLTRPGPLCGIGVPLTILLLMVQLTCIRMKLRGAVVIE